MAERVSWHDIPRVVQNGVMNSTQIKSLMVIGGLALLGFGPLSFTCLIGFYVVMVRPFWFIDGVVALYGGSVDSKPNHARTLPLAFAARIEAGLILLVLLILDIAPVPVTGGIGLYVILARPAWFVRLAHAVYGLGQGSA